MQEVLSLKINSFKYEDKVILENLDLSISKGECILITGLSGSGKSTLISLMSGIIPNFLDGNIDGDIFLLGKNLKEYNPNDLAKHIGFVFQNPKDQFFSTCVEDEVAFVGENLGMEKAELKKRVYNALDSMGILSLKDESIFELSGGQRQKVAIASTLVYDTDLIFFDEPSASLDPKSILEFRNIIKDLMMMGKTVIICEHRIFYLKDIFTSTYIIENKTLKDRFDKTLSIQKIKEHSLRRLDFKDIVAKKEVIYEDINIEVSNLDIEVKNKILLKNISFNVRKGEILGIIGENGIGKTSMVKQLAGLYKINKGKISYANSKRQRQNKSYLVCQDVDTQIFKESVEKELISKDKLKNEKFLKKVKDYLIDIDLWDYRLDHPQNLSSGQKQRLIIADALLSDRDLLILDEPSSGLDYIRMKKIAKLINEKVKDKSIIIISHDIELIFETCNSVLILGKDRVEKIPCKNNEKEIISYLYADKNVMI